MIEVLALAGAVKAISGAISAAVKAGQDASSLMPEFVKLDKLGEDIKRAEAGEHRGVLGNLWETVLREQAAARVRHAAALKVQAEKRGKIVAIIGMVFGAALFFILSGLVIFGASTLNK